MPDFRKQEWKKIEDFLSQGKSRLAVVYGRPGMGLHGLLKKISENRPTLFFKASPTCSDMENRLFSSSIGMQTVTGDLSRILDWISGQARLLSGDQELLLILSSYKNFIAASPENDETLRHYAADVWKELPIKVILADESILCMKKAFESPDSPWTKIDHVRLCLPPLSFAEAGDFLRGFRPEDAIFLYGMTGGIPALLEKISPDGKAWTALADEPDRNAQTAVSGFSGGKISTLSDLPGRKKSTSYAAVNMPSILEKLFHPDNRKPCHPESIIENELREPAFYNRLLTALASGYQRVGEIAQETGRPKDIVVPYLNTLIRLGLVKKERPMTEKGNQRKTRYSIVNTGDLFWYRYLAYHYDLLAKRQYDRIWTRVLLPDRSKFEKEVFVKIAGQYLLHCEGRLPFQVEELGGWWEYAGKSKNRPDRKGLQSLLPDEEGPAGGLFRGFDLIGSGSLQDQPASVFCRIYYDEKPVDVGEIKSLIALSRRLFQGGNHYYMIFSRAGFDRNARTVAEAIPEIILLTVSETAAWLLNS
ncbi:MAG: hypothetical protein PUE58_05680 [Lachnospiraceae bacterium]|nr:hypothetical protein [Lachnospiraceae bacterium]